MAVTEMLNPEVRYFVETGSRRNSTTRKRVWTLRTTPYASKIAAEHARMKIVAASKSVGRIVMFVGGVRVATFQRNGSLED